jgi:hypothetical protein
LIVLEVDLGGRLRWARFEQAFDEEASREEFVARLLERCEPVAQLPALAALRRGEPRDAAELVIEESTVRRHAETGLPKLDVCERVQAVILAYEARLTPAAPKVHS